MGNLTRCRFFFCVCVCVRFVSRLIPLSVVPRMFLCEKADVEIRVASWCEANLTKFVFDSTPNETVEENYTEKQNKRHGEGSNAGDKRAAHKTAQQQQLLVCL